MDEHLRNDIRGEIGEKREAPHALYGQPEARRDVVLPDTSMDMTDHHEITRQCRPNEIKKQTSAKKKA